ncbi:MAG: nucleotide exchange factor GrpE [Fimbriimonadaceae bacterium]|nr:nucleotide exchange factor GrpE [Fimbriimonadaceae bacterium]
MSDVENIEKPTVPAPETDEPVEEQADPRDELVAALTAERDKLREQLVYTMAEAQNVQKRLRQNFEQDKKYATEGLVRDLVPVLDNFERSLAAFEKGASAESLLDGVRAVHKQLLKALESGGVLRVPSTGEAFDPSVHEALVVTETDEHPDGTVLDELESGYLLHDRVVRPARVRVSQKPS